MNQPFMFHQNFGPYSDNPKFIKKCVSPAVLLVCVICVGLMLMSSVYFTLFASSTTGQFAADAYEKVNADTIAFLQTFGYSILDGFLILLFIAFICMLTGVKNKESQSIGAGPGIAAVFLVLSLVIFSFIILIRMADIADLIQQFTDSSADEEKQKTSISLISFCVSFIPAVLGLVWSILGVVFLSGVNRTAKCSGIFTTGGAAFGFFSKLLSAFNIALLVTYYINHINDGFILGKEPSGMAGIFTASVKDGIVTAAVFTVFLVANAVLLFCVGISVKGYTLAANAANRSIKMSGSNLFMNNDSSAARYYQSTYSSPAQDNTTPPPAAPVSEPPRQVSQDIVPDTETFSSGINCPVCGVENVPDCKFCTNCGNRLT